MGLIDLKPKWSRESSIRGENESSAILAWTALVDNPATDSVESILQEILGEIPSEHPDDSNKRQSSVRAARISPIMLDVEANYVGPTTGEGEDPGTGERQRIKSLPSISFSTTEEPIDVDADGVAIRTVNGEGYDPPITMEFTDLVLTFENDVSTVDYLQQWNYKGATNSDEFFGFPAGVARIIDITADPTATGPDIYYKQTTVVQFRKPIADGAEFIAWYRRQISEGFYEKVGGKIVRAVDEFGQPTTRPVLLDKDTGERINDPANAEWVYIKRYRSLPFAAFNIY